jgi:xylulokinase
MYLLGIDIGSTTIKVNIFDYAGKLMAGGSAPTLLHRHTSGAYWDPNSIWRSTVSAIREALGGITSAGDIISIAVTGMGMDALPLDQHDEILYPFISWHCNRTQANYEKLLMTIDKRKLFQITGQQMSRIHTITRLLWMRENCPEIFHKIDKWLLMCDFINFKLCGSKTTDFSMASTTGLLDLCNETWSDDLLSLIEIDINTLPSLTRSGTIIGRVTKEASLETGLSQTTLIVQGGHDYVCATLPVGAYKPGVIFNIAGTWEMLLATCGNESINDNAFLSSIKVDSHVIPGQKCIVADAVASDMIEWFIHVLLDASNQERIEKLNHFMDIANRNPGWSNLLFLPHFFGSPAPTPDEFSKGAFIGLKDDTSRMQVFKAVIEGLNFQFADMLSSIKKNIPDACNQIYVVGGLSKSRYYLQNKADIIGREIIHPDIPEVTSLGCSILGGVGAGIYSSIDEAVSNMKHSYIYLEPDFMSQKVFAQVYQLYRQVYPSLKQVNHELEQLSKSLI